MGAGVVGEYEGGSVSVMVGDQVGIVFCRSVNDGEGRIVLLNTIELGAVVSMNELNDVLETDPDIAVVGEDEDIKVDSNSHEVLDVGDIVKNTLGTAIDGDCVEIRVDVAGSEVVPATVD